MPFSDSLIGDNDFDPVGATESLIRQQTGDIPPDSTLDPRMLNTRLARKLNQPAPRVKIEKPADAVSRADEPLDLSDYGEPVPSKLVDPSLDFSDLGAPPNTPIAPSPETEKPKHYAFTRGFVSGMIEQNPKMTAEALEGLSHLAPDGAIGDVLRSGSKDLHKLSELNPAEYKTRAGSMWDIKGIDDALTWAGEQLGSGVASTLPPIATGLAGGVLGGRVAGRTGAVVGAMGGAAIPSAAMNYGEVYKALKDEKVDPKAAAEYAAYATPALVALDTVSIGPIITRLGGISAVKQEVARGIAKRIAAEAAKGAGREGITEALQEVVKDATVSIAADKPFWTAETAKGAIESGVAGALTGGAMGGMVGVRGDRVAPAPSQGGEATAGGAAPGAGPQPGAPGGDRSSPEDIADFVRRANESNPNAAAQEQMRADAEAARKADPANMSEAERTHAYAAAREAHGFDADDVILKAAGMSDEDIAKLDEQGRIDAVIRAGQQANRSQSNERPNEQPNEPNARETQEDRSKSEPADDAEYSTLRAYGYSDEDITNMSPRQRAREAQDAREGGIDPNEAMQRFKRAAAPEAQQEQPQAATPPQQPTGDGTRTAPTTLTTADDVKAAQPAQPKSPAQAEAENYRHAHVDLPTLGLTGRRNISVETGAGQERSGTAPDGTEWRVNLPEDVAYGRIKGTKGADGQPLDIFIGPRPDSPHVFVVDQHHPKGGGFDEHKIMAGFAGPIDALRAYSQSYTDRGGDRIGGVTALTPDQFKAWLDSGDTTQPMKKPASSAHKREEAGPAGSLTEASVRGPVTPKVGAEVGGDTAPAEERNTDTGQNVPENRSTLKAQQNQLMAGERAVQMFPKGTREMPLPPRMARVETERGIFHYNPEQTDAETIRKASADGRENELLGLGSIPKAEIARREAAGEKPVAIVERNAEGTEVRAAAGTEATAEQQRAELEKGKSPGNTVAIEDINDTLKKRSASAETDPMTLMQFIASKGGIKPSDELRALDLTGKARVKVPGRRGFFPVVTEKGEHHDDMRRAAQEAGYFPADKPGTPPESSLRHFYDALDEEHNRGNPLRRQGEEHVKTKRQQQSIKESSEHAHEKALIEAQDDIEAEYPGIPTDLRDLAAKIMVDERESDIDTAVERASIRLVEADEDYGVTQDDIGDTFGEGAFDEVRAKPASEDGEPSASEGAEKPRPGESEEDRADGERVQDSGAEVVQGEGQGVARQYPYTADRTRPTDIVPLPMELSEFQEITDEWAALFTNPESKTNLETKLKDGPFIPIEEAQKRIDQWRADAAAQAADPETFRANSSKTVLSLYDLSGNWSRPWAEAGYNVLTFDIQTGQDVNDFSAEYFTDNYDITDVYAILIAQPCTDFAVSGSKHFAAKDARGDTHKSVELVHQSLRTVEYFRPKVWALENPVSRIEKLTGLPQWRLLFNPNNFGSPYTKKTVLWGKFNADLPTANVEPIEGSKMHKKYGGKSQATKNARSETPEGFAYSFFKANNYADRSAEDRLPEDYPEVSGAVKAALKAGVTEARINELMENTYGNYEYEEARQALIDEVAKVRGGEPTTERTAAGDQSVLPGAERIGQGEQAQRAADRGLKPKVAQKAADEGLFGDSMDQADLLDAIRQNVDTVETALGDDAEKVAQVDITRAAELMAENEGMDAATAFGQSVIENAVSQNFITEPEAIEAYGEQAKDLLEAGRQGALGGGTHVEPGSAESGEVSPGGATQAGVVPSGGEARGEVAEGEATGNAERAGEQPAGRQPAAGDETGNTAENRPAAKNPNEPVGVNAKGQELFEDENGVRYRKERGIRIQEPVTLRPTRDRGLVPEIGERSPEWQTVAELPPDEQARNWWRNDLSVFGREQVVKAAGLPESVAKTLWHNLSPERQRRLSAIRGTDADPIMMRDAPTWAEILATMPRDKAGVRDLEHIFNVMSEITGAKNPAYGDLTPSQQTELLARLKGDSVTPNTERADGVSRTVPDGDAGASAEDVQPAQPRGQAGSVREREGAGSAPDVRGTDEGRAEGAGRVSEGAGGERGRGSRASGADRVSRARADDAADGRTERAAESATNVEGENYVIEPGSLQEDRGPLQKAKDNLAAIQTLKKVEAEGRPATQAEQAVLARYVGWGGLKNAFPGVDGNYGKGFEKIGSDLKEALTPDEYETARRSIQYAHYTSEDIVRSMWDAVGRMGYREGNVFEPGMGIGNFAGMMPADAAANTRYAGLEMDHITAGIAKLLYPKYGVRRGDFTKAPLPENYYDLIIGNPPFADVAVKADPKYKQGFLLHDYFFAKSIDAVRPGGLLAFVTSAGTMNKVDPAAREYIADRADLIGAIRLPNDAFAKNAGTKVTTDIIFLRKRLPSDIAGDRSWTEVVPMELADRDGGITTGNVNRYFVDHPEMILGEHGMFDQLAATSRYGVRSRPGADFKAELKKAIDALPSDVMEPWQEVNADRTDDDFGTTEKKEGTFYLGPNGELHQVQSGLGRPVQQRGKGVSNGKSAADIERIKGLIPIRDALRAVYAADLQGDAANAGRARDALNRHYDAFVEKFGPINKAVIQTRRPTIIQQEAARSAAREEARYADRPFREGSFDPSKMIAEGESLSVIARERAAAREKALAEGRPFDEGEFDVDEIPDIIIDKRPNVDPFMDDPESYRLRAIERYDEASNKGFKSPVFSENVITRERVPDISSVNDALLYSLSQYGRVNLPEMARLIGKSESDVLDELRDQVFRVPGTTDTYQTRGEYLSGNVRKKLDIARKQAERDPDFRRNVTALEAAQPMPLAPAQIHASLGMPWIPPETVRDFALNELGLSNLTVKYFPGLATWTVHGDIDSVAAQTTYGTADRRAPALISDALNRQNPKIYDKFRDEEGRERSVLNPDKTGAAQDKIKIIQEKFADWIWKDQDRADKLAQFYNEKFNNLVVREYDGSYLTTPGVAANWSWRPHQKRGIARIIQSGNTYLAHAVGAGKTSEMIGAVMEQRRLGLVRKPMIAVPNHMLAQFTKEFYEQYPTARLAIADERRFHTDRRKQFIANVAMEDLDAVIITHSAFGMIPVSEAFHNEIIQKEIDQYRELFSQLQGGDNRITRARVEKQIERLEQRLEGKGTRRKDQVFTFEEMGIDQLFVDEAHLFRKLDFSTQMSSLKGISPEGSQMAWDLYVKSQYLDTVRPGRGLVLASGTPITNTMAELYTVSRFLQPQTLAERGLEKFDAWAGAFGESVAELEQDAAGNYKSVSRFAKFVNVAELSAMVRQVMDVVTSRQLEQYVTRPKLKGGKRTMNLAEQSPEYKVYGRMLADRMKAIQERKGPPKKGDDIMLSVINDGRHAAIDMRLVGEGKSSTPSKLDMLIDNVARIHKESTRQKFYKPGQGGEYETKVANVGPATQMIFANLGLSGKRGFSVPDYIRSELVRRGVPKSEIAYIYDYKNSTAKQRLFNDMNEGKVRVLLGSTAKMATGVNAQRRLLAIHNLDPLWFPSDDEQRNGRGLRQGNMNPEIEINDYSTKGTYDSTMWGMMEKKARFIQAFFEGDPSLRDMDDLGEASQYEQAKALTTNDPRLIKLTELKQDLERATRRKTAFESEAYALRQNRASAKSQVEHYNNRIEQTEKDIASRVDISGDKFSAAIGKEKFDKRVDYGEALFNRLDQVAANGTLNGAIKVSEIGGFPIYASAHKSLIKGDKGIEVEVFVGLNGGHERAIHYGSSALGTVRSIESVLTGLDGDLAEYQARKAKAEKFLTDSNDKVKARFQGDAEIDRLTDQVRELQAELASSAPDDDTPPPGGGGEGLASAAPQNEFAELDRLTQRAEPYRPQIEDLLREIVQRIAGGFHVRLNDGPIPIGKLSGYGGANAQWARGMYYPARALIEIALTGPTKKIIKSAFHESYHAIEDRMQTDAERELMKRETEKMRLWLKQHQDHAFSASMTDKLAGYEVRAMAFEHYAYDRAHGMAAERAGAGLHIGVRRWFDRLWNALQRLANGLRGMGFKTWRDIFDEALSGEFSRREASQENKIDTEDMASTDGMASAFPGSQDNVAETLYDKLSEANFHRLAAVSKALRLGNINISELRTQLQDKFIRVREAEQSVDGTVPTAQSAYQAESLYYGRAGEQLEKLEREQLDPLIKDMKDRDISLEEINDYLYAKHAPERNAAMDEINHPELSPGSRDLRGRGSGMSDEEAADIMKRFADRLPDFEAIEARVRKIIDDTRNLLVESGLISQDVADAWASKYQFYVPLRGFAEGGEEGGYARGAGYDTRAAETKQAFGRLSRAAGPLAFVMHQAEMAIVRAEKNRVGNAFLRFARSHPDRDRWSVDTPPVKKQLDPRTGLVTQVEDRNWYLKPDVFVTKVGGRPVLIQMHGKEGENLVRALKNMGSSNMGSFVRFMHKLTTTLSRLSTQWNPNFVIPNFARDVGEAFLNLQAQDQARFVTQFSKHLFPSIKGAFNGLRGADGGKYGQAFRDFDKAGGRIRFFGLENHDDISANIDRRLRRLKGGTINNLRAMGEAAADAFEVVNGAIENATRLAAFQAARDVGMTDADAAMLARNLTVDFNKKGEYGSTLNAFYMFINASIQGSVRIARALTHKNVRRAVLGLIAIGALGALYNFGAGGDDDAGENYYSKLPPWIRDKNLIIMWPNGMGHDGEYVKIPLPFGFSPFHVLGNRLAGVFLGKDKPTDAIWSVMSSIADAFNPLGEESASILSLLPSVARPAAHIQVNKNWNGNPLYPDYDYQKHKPDSEKAFRSTSGFSKTAAREINRATGGSPYKSGWLDWHPGSIDHVLETIVGGLGKFVGDVVATGGAAYRGDAFDINKAPIIRRFYGTSNDAKSDNMLYYRDREEAKKNGISSIKQAQKDRGRGINREEATEFIHNNKNAIKAETIFKNADKQMKPLRDRMDRLKADEKIGDTEKRQQLDDITNKMRAIQNHARKQYIELKRGTAP